MSAEPKEILKVLVDIISAGIVTVIGAVLYSTHYMEEAERLCNRIVLIDHGKIVAQGTDRELIALAGTEPRIEIMTKKALPPGWSNGIAGVGELPLKQISHRIGVLQMIESGHTVAGEEQGGGKAAVLVRQGDEHVAAARPDVQRFALDAI